MRALVAGLVRAFRWVSSRREGPGIDDVYAIYANFLYRNPTERLFQAESSVVLYNNLSVNPAGSAIAIMPHNGDPRRIDIFQNTILARNTGLRFVRSERTERAFAHGSAVFAVRPFAPRVFGWMAMPEAGSRAPTNICARPMASRARSTWCRGTFGWSAAFACLRRLWQTCPMVAATSMVSPEPGSASVPFGFGRPASLCARAGARGGRR